MKSHFLIFFLFIPFISFAKSNEIDSLLAKLDKAISEHKSFMEIKELRINSLKGILKNDNANKEQTYNICNQLYNEYRIYNIDSCLHYLNLNLSIAESLNKAEWINETRLHLSRIFSTSGMYKESMDMLEAIDTRTLVQNQKIDFYSCYELLYNELAKYTQSNLIAGKYRTVAYAYRDSLLRYLDHNSDEYCRLLELKFFEEGSIDESKRITLMVLDKAKENTPEFAYWSYRMAMNYAYKGNTELEKKYLIESAISDITLAIKDNTSLNLLAALLYREREIDRAYKYIKFALEDANFFNARLRLVQVSNILPVINQAYQTKSDYQKTKLTFYLIIISILSVFLLFAVLFIYKQMNNLSGARNDLQIANNQLMKLNDDLLHVNEKLKDLNIELLETNKIKEHYIGLFLSICSTYIDKLENYRRMTNKLITSGKVAELYETTKSRQLIENELKEFYENFDNTFLNIYPNFVEDLNALLVEEEKITLRKGELLNTELRIFALIRLGITDSSKIAALLRYSVNTIYNYRVKIKNKSLVPRNNFEDMVMKIGTFSK